MWFCTSLRKNIYISFKHNFSYVFLPQRRHSLGFLVQLEEFQDVQHGLSDVGAKTMGVLQCIAKMVQIHIIMS